MTEKNLKDIITKKALQLGFDKIGFANPSQQVDPNNYFCLLYTSDAADE